MNILEYLFYNEITKKDFAKRLGITRDYFSHCTQGHRVMGMVTCKKVEKQTKGAITAEAMRLFSIQQWEKNRGK